MKKNLKKLALLGIASGAVIVSQAGEAAPYNKGNQTYLANNSCGKGTCSGKEDTNNNRRNQSSENPHAYPSYPANYSSSSFQYRNSDNLTALNDDTEKTSKSSTGSEIKNGKQDPYKNQRTTNPAYPKPRTTTNTNSSNLKQNLSKKTQNRTSKPIALSDSSIDRTNTQGYSAPNANTNSTLPNSNRAWNNKNDWNSNSQDAYPRPASSSNNYDEDDNDYDDNDDNDNYKNNNYRSNQSNGSRPNQLNQNNPYSSPQSYSRNQNRSYRNQTALNDTTNGTTTPSTTTPSTTTGKPEKANGNDYNSNYRDDRTTNGQKTMNNGNSNGSLKGSYNSNTSR